MPMARDLDLKGDLLEQLQAALVAAFPDRFGFRQLMLHKLDTDLDAIVGNVGLAQVAFDLIEWAKAEGRLAQLVGCALAENPGNPELKAFAERVGIQPGGVVRAPGPAEANRGLAALGELMATGDAREAVRAFEAEFQDAVGQIEVLGVFKDVHDLLHTLQFRCYDGLARQTPRFPADGLAREIVNEHGVTLEETIVRLEAITANPVFDQGTPRWIGDLREARTQITTALDTSSVQPLTSAVRLIDRVLAVQPTRINTRLNDAARALRLRDLVADLTQVHTRLSASGLDATKMSEFEAGISSLQQLDVALRHRVTEHDRWQELDVELRLEKNAFLVDVEVLGSAWPRLRAQLLPLCGGTEPWATHLTADCGKLDAALAARDVANQRSTFIQVHSQAATRFYQVDIALQRLCETLREIGKPLTELLRKMQ
jgi:effector-associated domain 1 (EAD1)-containing protein